LASPTIVAPSKTLEEIDFQLDLLSTMYNRSTKKTIKVKLQKDIDKWLDQRLRLTHSIPLDDEVTNGL
jgi:hypothetical protein